MGMEMGIQLLGFCPVGQSRSSGTGALVALTALGHLKPHAGRAWLNR